MNRGWIDVSVPVAPGATPLWPGSPAIELERRLDVERGDPVTDTTLRCSVHTGTHVDAPAHVLSGFDTVETLELDALMGPCRVAHVPGREQIIEAADLEEAELTQGVERVLLRTDNSAHWTEPFRRDFTGLSRGAAAWLTERSLRLVGVDYLSVEPWEGDGTVHRLLLEAGIVLVEGLILEGVAEGDYELRCLPIKLSGAEAAPARAVLRRVERS